MNRVLVKYWHAALRIGLDPSMDYTQQTRLFVINAFLWISLGLTILFVSVFVSLGSYSALQGLLVIPVLLLIFYFNSRSLLSISRAFVTYGLMVLVLGLALADRRTGTEYILIALGCCSVVVYEKLISVVFAFLFAFACYVAYIWYDTTHPFVPDPSLPYMLAQNSLMFLSGFAVLAQSLVFRALINGYADRLRQASQEIQSVNEELQASNEELLSFTENLDSMVKEKSSELKAYLDGINVTLYSATTDLNGNILKVNDRLLEVSGYTESELIGQNFRLLDSGFHPPEFFKTLYDTVHAGKSWRGEVRNKAKDGNFFWIDMVVIPAEMAGRGTFYLLVLALPVTERKKLEEEHLATVMALEDVAFQTSHKIRGPLARITGLTNLLQLDAVEKLEINYVAEKLVESSWELDKATHDLILFIYQHQNLHRVGKEDGKQNDERSR